MDTNVRCVVVDEVADTGAKRLALSGKIAFEPRKLNTWCGRLCAWQFGVSLSIARNREIPSSGSPAISDTTAYSAPETLKATRPVELIKCCLRDTRCCYLRRCHIHMYRRCSERLLHAYTSQYPVSSDHFIPDEQVIPLRDPVEAR